MESYYLVFYSLLTIILYKFLSSTLRSFSQARKARQLGCQPITEVPRPAWDYLTVIGIAPLEDNIRNAKVFRFPESVCERTARVGALTYKSLILGQWVYFTVDPKNVQAMLATQFKDFSLGPNRRGSLFPLLGNGIFTADGPYWEHSRAMLRPSFARERVSNLDLEARHAANLMLALPTDPTTCWTPSTDIQTLFFRLTLDSSTEFLFGESVNSQIRELRRRDDEPDAQQQQEASFAYAFDNAQAWLTTRIRLGGLHNWASSAEFRDSCRVCHDFIDYYVRLALAKSDSEKNSSRAESSSALEKDDGESAGKEKLIFLEELAQQTRDPVELRSQLLHILLAGRDTTASLLSWLFFLMARQPHTFARLRRAVLEDFGTYAAPREITFTSLKSSATLQHYLSEALRLYPAVHANMRTAEVDTTLPRGGGPDGTAPVFVPRGTEVNYNVYNMHRLPSIWGPDADEFKPERWEGRKPGWEFLPFNGGPRICLGQQFALTSAGHATVRLLQRFDEIEGLDLGEVRQNAILTTNRQGGVKVRLHEAS